MNDEIEKLKAEITILREYKRALHDANRIIEQLMASYKGTINLPTESINDYANIVALIENDDMPEY